MCAMFNFRSWYIPGYVKGYAEGYLTAAVAFVSFRIRLLSVWPEGRKEPGSGPDFQGHGERVATAEKRS